VFFQSSETEPTLAAETYYKCANACIAAMMPKFPDLAKHVWLSEAPEWFPTFFEWIGATGDLDAAVAELRMCHNQRKDVGTIAGKS